MFFLREMHIYWRHRQILWMDAICTLIDNAIDIFKMHSICIKKNLKFQSSHCRRIRQSFCYESRFLFYTLILIFLRAICYFSKKKSIQSSTFHGRITFYLFHFWHCFFPFSVITEVIRARKVWNWIDFFLFSYEFQLSNIWMY